MEEMNHDVHVFIKYFRYVNEDAITNVSNKVFLVIFYK